MRTAYFHEDDYCQIELVCDENLEWCLDQTRRIADFANAHRAGEGWSEMYVRPEKSVELAARGIAIGALAGAVTPHLPPYDAVTTGYTTVTEDLPNTHAFGAASDVVLFAAHPDGIVSAIWFEMQPSDDSAVASAAATLMALAQWRLLLVDWAWGRVIPLTDHSAVDAYLRERGRSLRELAEKLEQQRKQEASLLGRVRRWMGLKR